MYILYFSLYVTKYSAERVEISRNHRMNDFSNSLASKDNPLYYLYCYQHFFFYAVKEILKTTHSTLTKAIFSP